MLSATAGRLSTVREQAGDWDHLTSLMALALAHCWLAGPAADTKLLKAVTRLHTKVCPLLRSPREAVLALFWMATLSTHCEIENYLLWAVLSVHAWCMCHT